MSLNLRRSVVFAVLAIVLTFIYALVGTGLSQLAFKGQADGSITTRGSTLIGQNWSSPQWFHGRPDDAGPYAADPKKDVSGGDNPLEANGVPGESGASNLGPRSSVLLDNTRELVQYWHRLGVDPTPDLVTTSGSG
ncbi:MAG TPA: potassium-transporting ATPase subunit C, partial [Acidimicrobiales bacterium]|nr:potassium-transporting ATPase subunit C [Acidimicrobiales bacterium]